MSSAVELTGPFTMLNKNIYLLFTYLHFKRQNVDRVDQQKSTQNYITYSYFAL